MGNRFYNSSDVQKYIHNSVIRYNGRPVLAYCSDRGMQIEIVDLLNDERKVVDANDDAIDVSSPPLGFVNEASNPVYIARSPYRRTKQGVDGGCLLGFIPGAATGDLIEVDNRALGETIMGIYPSYSEVYEKFRQGGKGRAFDRKLCMTYSYGVPIIGWRTFAVGFFNPVKNSVHLHPFYKGTPVTKQLSKHMRVENA